MKTILLVRHADVSLLVPTGPDTVLTPRGEGRANDLARLGVSAGATAIYTSPVHRTKQTAAPLAAALGIAPKVAPDAAAAFKAEVLSAAAGPVVVVVGHSNTVPTMVEALGAVFPGPQIPPDEFDNLFVVTVPAAGPAGVTRLKYGTAPVPFDPTGNGVRETVVVDGVVFDLPAVALDIFPDGRPVRTGKTPYTWAHLFVTMHVTPHTLWLNGTCYGSVSAGDKVHLNYPLGLTVNGEPRGEVQDMPWGLLIPPAPGGAVPVATGEAAH